jgi:DNA-binding NtrC family response regulator
MNNVQKLSILYFDDEPICLEVFREMFGDDHEIRTAETLEDARRALVEDSFDVVISDQCMPEITGIDFLREIAREHPHTYRVMMTGNTCVGEVLEEFTTGVIKFFVPKPWSDATMQEVFERARL